MKNPPQLSDAGTERDPGVPAVPTLRERKVRAVRESIWDAAMDLFAEKGYDETTVEDIARAAGISLRSFFRYFLSKGDLMSYSLLVYGNQLAAAIEVCPADYPLREVFRESISSVAHLALRKEDRTRKHLEILKHSQAAAAAEMSRLSEVQVLVARAYERRLPAGAERALAATAMAGVSLHLTGTAVRWCLERGESALPATMERVLAALEGVFCTGRYQMRGEQSTRVGKGKR